MRKTFKIACLAYEPSKVIFRDEVLPRFGLLERRRALMERQRYLLSVTEVGELCNQKLGEAFPNLHPEGQRTQIRVN